MSDGGEWSPDEPLGTETPEAWDEALDAEDEGEPEGLERSEGERSLDRQLFVDEAEVDEAGVRLDDPDGVDTRRGADGPRPGDEGWDLDAGEDVGDADARDLE